MVRHSLAARSLRHLRFAHRMMVGQPLLARASEGLRSGHQPAYISFDGRQLPLGHILRRLPRHVAPSMDDSPAYAPPASDIGIAMSPSDAAATLRLLPSGSEPDNPDDFEAAMADTTIDDVAPPARMRDEARRSADDTPASAPEPHSSEPARHDGRRPRSRIVELPGVIVQPVAQEDDEGSAGSAGSEITESGKGSERETMPETRADAAMDVPVDNPATIPVDVQDDDQQIAQPTLLRDEPPPTPQPADEPPAPAPRRRGGKRAAQQPRASDALFPPTDTDRSPQTWLARLQQQAAPGKPTPDDEPPARGSVGRQLTGVPGASRGNQAASAGTVRAPGRTTPSSARPPETLDAPDAVERPAQVSASSRTLLREATGVDPESVRIYRGPEAARVTSAQNSDALTDGGVIALGAGHATDTPETLGLLAHELTHVAQRREPRFVPPVAQAVPARRPSESPRQPQRQPKAQPATLPTSPAPPSAPASPADEEAQAALVEARVTSSARAQQAASFTAPVAEPEQPLRGEQRQRPATRPLWGNLPAPWEPLPDWLTNPTDAPESALDSQAAPAPQQAGQRTAVRIPSSASGSGTASSATPAGVQRAERGRALPAAESEAPQASSAHEGPAPEPDLDALAQQVHAILKRRLAAERRRFG